MVPVENTMKTKAKYYNVGDTVKGQYYETPYVGIVTERRFHSLDWDTVIYTVKFPAPLAITVVPCQGPTIRDGVMIDCFLDGRPHSDDQTIELVKV